MNTSTEEIQVTIIKTTKGYTVAVRQDPDNQSQAQEQAVIKAIQKFCKDNNLPITKQTELSMTEKQFNKECKRRMDEK
jgi:hypothetical protein